VTLETIIQIKARIDALVAAEDARFRATEGLAPDVRIAIEMTDEIHALHLEYEAALAREGKLPQTVVAELGGE
jgi:hypothetical protein